jgi:hypothetical protein
MCSMVLAMLDLYVCEEACSLAEQCAVHGAQLQLHDMMCLAYGWLGLQPNGIHES